MVHSTQAWGIITCETACTRCSTGLFRGAGGGVIGESQKGMTIVELFVDIPKSASRERIGYVTSPPHGACTAVSLSLGSLGSC